MNCQLWPFSKIDPYNLLAEILWFSSPLNQDYLIYIELQIASYTKQS